ncbi:DUF1338 domain-containing protein [Thalassoglobus polymorphus]|uniref:2-oxoadipate dioxygenase/decarboxylase n=1 Tax=Thalassoglobus polymorphus TaxID=2527994 RepID=A0A517QPF9_9PLAN|nr:DUF1338 domain-containing protein [Thalassoglobus polymorphus]QDT33516.1 hypothetical protein Mal48_27690 [Thalassoglobus polymorphus]
MSQLDSLLQTLWDTFQEMNPQAEAIHQLLSERGETVINDHIAFRTFDDPRVGIQILAKPFLVAGYKECGSYEFPGKHLFAKHYEHSDEQLPKIFISELKLNEMSEELQATAKTLVDQISSHELSSRQLCAQGRLWDIDHSTYSSLVEESEYAGWLSAFGFCANHFTVSVNALKSFMSLQELNEFVKSNGFPLNAMGGEIKGSPEELLEQSSTLAAQMDVSFSDGTFSIPSCYYEFARRYEQPDGKIFTGFIAKSADKIFQSTDRRE